MSAREIVVVDVETNGLDPSRHQVVEVAWWNLTTDERGRFVPLHDPAYVLRDADIRALQLNRYIDRIADAEQDHDYIELNRFHDAVDDRTIAGSNPAFDAAFLRIMFQAANRLRSTPWHHRMWDLSAYAAGVLGLTELPGLSTVCELLDIEPGNHTAEDDVTATGLCLLELMSYAQLAKKVSK